MATAILAKTISPPIARRSRNRYSWLRSRKIQVGLALIGIFVLSAIVGPWLAPYDPSATSADVGVGPSVHHLLGTTSLGEDVLSQLLVGARLSLEVGFLAALVGEAAAAAVGITAGYFGGVVDEGLSLITNIFLVIPILPLQILIIAYLGNTGWLTLALIIAMTAWPHGARKLRAQTLSLRRRDFVEAARVAGEPAWRIIACEILPNELAIIVTGFLFHVLSAIIVQTSLAFLGLGDLSAWSWGAILYWSQSANASLIGMWWWYAPPGLCLALLGMGLAMVNLGIDEVINPRLRGGRVTGRVRRNLGRRTVPASPVAVPASPVAVPAGRRAEL
jgi:peptide/nickel transport system permease protein